MKDYECRVCGKNFRGKDKRNLHEKIDHTKSLDKFGFSRPEFEKPDKEVKKSHQRTLRFF